VTDIATDTDDGDAYAAASWWATIVYAYHEVSVSDRTPPEHSQPFYMH